MHLLLGAGEPIGQSDRDGRRTRSCDETMTECASPEVSARKSASALAVEARRAEKLLEAGALLEAERGEGASQSRPSRQTAAGRARAA